LRVSFESAVEEKLERRQRSRIKGGKEGSRAKKFLTFAGQIAQCSGSVRQSHLLDLYVYEGLGWQSVEKENVDDLERSNILDDKIETPEEDPQLTRDERQETRRALDANGRPRKGSLRAAPKGLFAELAFRNSCVVARVLASIRSPKEEL